jgi:hypothetical protein
MNFGITNDNDPSVNHQSTTAHFVTQLASVGVSWKTYQEDISGTTCPLTSVANYAPKHNPFVYFDDVTGTIDSAVCGSERRANIAAATPGPRHDLSFRQQFVAALLRTARGRRRAASRFSPRGYARRSCHLCRDDQVRAPRLGFRSDRLPLRPRGSRRSRLRSAATRRNPPPRASLECCITHRAVGSCQLWTALTRGALPPLAARACALVRTCSP